MRLSIQWKLVDAHPHLTSILSVRVEQIKAPTKGISLRPRGQLTLANQYALRRVHAQVLEEIPLVTTKKYAFFKLLNGVLKK